MAVWKEPLDGPRLVRRLNIDGDGQGDLAGHGGEQRAYSYTRSSLIGIGRTHLSATTTFHVRPVRGKHLTVQGLTDDEVCIGDRYRIGSAVFEVSQPRSSCYRVGIRMDDARMPALAAASAPPTRFYFRVLREGMVQAGDEIVLIARGPGAMTVKLAHALHLPGHSRQRVARALQIPALSPGWKMSFEGDTRAGSEPGATGNPGPQRQ
jgi:MOSC domain-containing protein YiiM